MRTLDHWFYTAMAFAISAGVFAGFFRTYFGSKFFGGPSLPFWVHVHGAVFTLWILFYLLQNLLALSGGMRLHRQLGFIGGALAAGVVILGLLVTLREVREGRAFPFPDIYAVLAVSTAQMILFALMVGGALVLKKEPEAHKRLILMSTQLFFFPAFGRLLNGINVTTLALALCFYLAGPVYDLIRLRRIQWAYAAGVPLLILTMPPFSVMASGNSVWHRFVDFLISA
jgi:hypothetical protein